MNLTKGRSTPCKNNAGGIRELYLMAYTEYDVRSIIGYRDLLITSFPTTQMYRYEGTEISFSETINNEGFYDQDLGFKLIKQDLNTTELLSILLRNKVRALVTDNNGESRLVGVINGLDVDIDTNGGGAKGDFNGYTIKLKGAEEFPSPFVDGPEDAGLTDKEVIIGCILASSDRPASISDKVSSCNAVTSVQ